MKRNKNRVMISVDPVILKAINKCAEASGLSRSAYIINAVTVYWKLLDNQLNKE